MPVTTRDHLVIYDVRDPKRWRHVHRIVLGYGRRVQLSVFRVRATPTAIERLRWELERVMAEEDHLLIVPLCPRCAQRVNARHDSCEWPEDDPPFRIVD